MALYRVFLSRHFIAVTCFEVEAPTAKRAQGKALKAANKEYESQVSREMSTDNGWYADTPVSIEKLGQWASGVNEVREVSEGVWQIEGLISP